MAGILSFSLKCIPCIVPVVGLVGLVVTLGINKNQMIYVGVLPSDGPIGGFASKADRIRFWDTSQRRGRVMVRSLVTWVIVTLLGSGLVWLFTTFSINVSTK